MRFIPAVSLVEGMVCGKNLYDMNHLLLLREGSVVQEGYGERIRSMGYQGIYIDDEIGQDIEVKDVISDELRMSAVKAIKEIHIIATSDTSDKVRAKQIGKTKVLVSNIVEQILGSRDTMVNLIDLKFYDDYTFFHSVNVAVLSILIGVEYGLSRNELLDLGLASILHDIGKIFIDLSILNKPSKLTDEEFSMIKQHPTYGYNYLKGAYDIPTSVYMAVFQHHERFDGMGYPMKKQGKNILNLARIISVADVYDALISARPYRKPLLPSEAMEYIMANGGLMFDPEISKIFARKVAPFPIGTYVRMSNGMTGIVYANHDDACMRPTVKVILDQNGHHIEPFYMDLRTDRTLRSVTITGINDLIIRD